MPRHPHPIQVLLCPRGVSPAPRGGAAASLEGRPRETVGPGVLAAEQRPMLPGRRPVCVWAVQSQLLPGELSLNGSPSLPPPTPGSPGPKSRLPGASEDVYSGLGPGQAPSLPRGPPLPPASGRRPRLQAQLQERSPEPRHAREPTQPAGCPGSPTARPLVLPPLAWSPSGLTSCLFPCGRSSPGMVPSAGEPGWPQELRTPTSFHFLTRGRRGPVGAEGWRPGGCNPALSPLLRRE